MITWLKRLLQRGSSTAMAAQAHITFGATSVGRSISRTRLVLRKQLWIWPIIALAILASIGYGLRTAIERTMRQNLQSQLETLLNVERSMLETWLKVQESNAESLANAPRVREICSQLLMANSIPPGVTESTPPPSSPTTQPIAPPAPTLHRALAQEIASGMSAHDFVSFIFVDKEQRTLSSSNPELIGVAQEELESFRSRALEGELVVSTPFPSIILMKDERGKPRTGLPTMYVFAPVRDSDFQVIGVLGFRIRPEREFTRIVQLGQFGESGETYAIDKTGRMVSSSRFDESLILMGLLPDVEDSRSILNISVRDPGGNLDEGYRPKVRRSELPLTKSASAAISGAAGNDLDGYRDYRGVPVVGVWTWLPKYQMGLITEIDRAEAYRPLSILQWSFFSMFGLLGVSSAAIFVFTLVVAQLQREAQKAAIEARHLGQYRLEERLGAGAMGVVYKGHHAMLRRPTAIKMLDVDKVNEASIQRFEREVQTTCNLNHPNTVAVYDYGRTPEGVFYYAMEFLDGIDLQALVESYGPQSEGRVIYILKQICGSLFEAHSLGLVHRDMKPANVMLNRRGGESDVVKVLDFGLVKALDDAKQARQSGGLAGTPLYMSPEAIQTPDLVDARSDLYAVGAVGYFLVTGQPVFNATSLVDLCQQQIVAVPESPSQRLGRAVSQELESALLACLEKNRAKRPQTARDLIALLDRAPTARSWSLEEADAWWGRHERSQSAASNAVIPEPGIPSRTAANGPADSPVADLPNSSPGLATGKTKSGFDQTLAHDERAAGR